MNLLLLTDSYKVSHWKQYPPDTEVVYSYLESRGEETVEDFRGQRRGETTFFGLQYLVKKYLEGQVVTRERIDELSEVTEKHLQGSFANIPGWEYILRKHDGYLPLKIKAVPEGMTIPCHNVLMTIENTDPNCYWLTNYVETLAVQVWYPTTVATLSRNIKNNILKYLEITGTPEQIDFKLHDFGFRGVSSVQSAGIGGAAHLVNFKGTDTLEALRVAKKYYGEDCAGFSIPASEHSTITAWGKENEEMAFNNMLNTYPTGLVACVSDSFDIYKACSDLWGTKLKDKVMARDGTLVIRPDSGDAVTLIPKLLEILGEKFGYAVNEKGYKVLDPHVRLIQGDGVDYTTIDNILYAMKLTGWSADNIGFGMGGALLQKLHRDTFKFAFKCSSITRSGKQTAVYKDPITAPGKISKKGRLKLVQNWDGNFQTTHLQSEYPDVLATVFLNGEIIKEYSFDEIRENAKTGKEM